MLIRIFLACASFVIAALAPPGWPPSAGNLAGPERAFASSRVASSEVVMPVRLEKERAEALRSGTMEAKERKGVAMAAFARYLSESLKGGGTSDARVDAFTQKALREFSKYVPAYRVEPQTAPDPSSGSPSASVNEARVTLTLATAALIAELEKQGFRPQANSNGSFNSAPGQGPAAGAGSPAGMAGGGGFPSGSSDGSGVGAATATAATASGTDSGATAAKTIPYAAFLVDERSHDVWVVPPEALASYAIDNAPSQGNAGYRFRAAAALKAVAPSDAEVNSVGSSLAVRAAHFSNKILYHLQLKNLVFKPEWTKQVLAFLEATAQVAKGRGETRAWPPALPWTLSSLHSNPGLVVILTVRSDDRAGVLERVEIAGSNGGKLLRHYWSRPMHDPAYQEPAARALEKAATSFARLHRVKRPDPAPANLGFWIDKRVSERDVLAVENILRTFALGEDSLLVPTDVTRDDVRYRTPVSGPRAEKVLERVRGSVPGVSAKLASGEPPVILLAPKTGAKPAP